MQGLILSVKINDNWDKETTVKDGKKQDRGQDYKEKEKLNSKQISNSTC